MKKAIFTVLIVFVFGTAYAADCVTKQEVLDAIEALTPKEDSGVTYTNCDPCSCGSQYGEAACYQWLADKARAAEERNAKAKDVIRRFDEAGICK